MSYSQTLLCNSYWLELPFACTHREGATFIYVVYKLSEHVLPPEATKLEVSASERAKHRGLWNMCP